MAEISIYAPALKATLSVYNELNGREEHWACVSVYFDEGDGNIFSLRLTTGEAWVGAGKPAQSFTVEQARKLCDAINEIFAPVVAEPVDQEQAALIEAPPSATVVLIDPLQDHLKEGAVHVVDENGEHAGFIPLEPPPVLPEDMGLYRTPSHIPPAAAPGAEPKLPRTNDFPF